jgi:TRAP-type C4-dicarboxylate transport system substrate-binding protein
LEEKANQKSLCCFFPGEVELISKRPVKTLEDWQGLLTQCDTPAYASTIENLGGSPVVMPFTEVYSALQKGVVDAGLQTPQGTIVNKFYETAKYYMCFSGFGAVFSITINMDVWNEMPTEIQDILSEEMKQLAQNINERNIQTFSGHIEELTELGVDVYFLPKEERDKWLDLLTPYTSSRLSELGETGQQIQQIADEVNEEHPYAY